MIELEFLNKGSKNGSKERISTSSIISNPELSGIKNMFLSLSILIINITSFIIGIYILSNNDYYLSSEIQFKFRKSLITFIILYSLGMIFSLLISFIISFILKLLICIFNTCKRIKSTENYEERKSIDSLGLALKNANNISLTPYTFGFFVPITLIIYFISLPYSIIILIFIIKNEIYSYYYYFKILYYFVLINIIAGLILLILFLFVVCSKRNRSFRKDYHIDEDYINRLRNEIREAMTKVEE